MPRSHNFIDDLTDEFLSGNTTDVSDAVTFIESPWGLNFPLFPAQRFVLKCFYGLPLDDQERSISVPDIVNDKILYTFTETEFLQFLYDEGLCNTNKTAGKHFSELVLVVGRRGTKSSLAACISCYELYKLVKRGDPSKHYGFPPETNICITNVAPTDDQASIVFDMIQQRALACPFLHNRSINQTLTYFNISTDADLAVRSKRKRASLTVLAAGCSSNSLRGRNNIVIIMDEMAFFIDNQGRFSGSEVYKALKPSTASFKGDGKVINISSPYAKYGQFWDLYTQSFNDTENMLMFQMYSAMSNPTVDSNLLRAERRRDKIGFLTEYAAEFSDKVTSWVDDEERFRACVVSSRPKPSRGMPGIDYFMGLDLGLKNDGTAIGIVHVDYKTKKIVVDWCDVWFGGQSDVWDVEKTIYKDCDKYAGCEIIPVSEIVKEVVELCRWFPIKKGWFDQYNGYALLEQLHKAGLTQFHMVQVTDTLNSSMYELWKTLYSSQMVELYNAELLISEVLALEAERKAKKKVQVRAQNKRGAHDDISDAVCRAIWEAYNHYKDKGQAIASGIKGHTGNLISAPISMNRFKQFRNQHHGVVRARTLPKFTRTKFR